MEVFCIQLGDQSIAHGLSTEVIEDKSCSLLNVGLIHFRSLTPLVQCVLILVFGSIIFPITAIICLVGSLVWLGAFKINLCGFFDCLFHISRCILDSFVNLSNHGLAHFMVAHILSSGNWVEQHEIRCLGSSIVGATSTSATTITSATASASTKATSSVACSAHLLL